MSLCMWLYVDVLLLEQFLTFVSDSHSNDPRPTAAKSRNCVPPTASGRLHNHSAPNGGIKKYMYLKKKQQKHLRSRKEHRSETENGNKQKLGGLAPEEQKSTSRSEW